MSKCQNCAQQFNITDEDKKFYKKMDVPEPTFCPQCRLIRRLNWRNERALYKRSCDSCKKNIIAMYPEEAPFPVYCRSCWYSDKWDSAEYGQDYDFDKSFFKQFRSLMLKVPRIALQVDNCVGCDFANQILDSKNCYLITSGSDNEDCLYTHRLMHSRDVVDCLFSLKGELCYQSIEFLNSSRLKFSNDCNDSIDLSFCSDARGCQNSFMSSNMRRQNNYFRNKQISAEQFKEKIKEIDTGSYKNIKEYKKEFEKVKQERIYRFANSKKAINSIGQSMNNTKNCHHCFNVADLEDCRYCMFVNDAKDSVDINNGCCVMELNYEVSTMGVNASNIKFCVDAWPEVRDTEYSDTCRNGSNDLFGCISARKKQYCILNKQYSESEYKEMIPKIKKHMNDMPYADKKGRVYKYGEFFPMELSPFAYNDSVAQEYYPLSEKQATEKGYSWRDLETRDVKPSTDYNDLPDHIKDVKDDILKQTILCKHWDENEEEAVKQRCTKAFRIIPQELKFYQKMNLALPRMCPNCRHFERLRQRNPLKLWHRKCMKKGCDTEFETSYAPERKEIVYCEECYLKEVG